MHIDVSTSAGTLLCRKNEKAVNQTTVVLPGAMNGSQENIKVSQVKLSTKVVFLHKHFSNTPNLLGVTCRARLEKRLISIMTQ